MTEHLSLARNYIRQIHGGLSGIEFVWMITNTEVPDKVRESFNKLWKSFNDFQQVVTESDDDIIE